MRMYTVYKCIHIYIHTDIYVYTYVYVPIHICVHAHLRMIYDYERDLKLVKNNGRLGVSDRDASPTSWPEKQAEVALAARTAGCRVENVLMVDIASLGLV